MGAASCHGGAAIDGRLRRVAPRGACRARPDGDEWIVDGVAPWVSGWGLTDVVHVAARTPDDDVVWLLVDVPSSGMRAEVLRLLAVNASATVTLHFDGVRVDADRETSRFPWSEWPARDAMGLRTNGSLALGVADRCCRLIGPSGLDEELAVRRTALDAGTVETMPAERAAAAVFAVRAASALVAHQGSASVVVGNHAERLLREATLLLVFGSRPSIRRQLLAQLGVRRRAHLSRSHKTVVLAAVVIGSGRGSGTKGSYRSATAVRPSC